MSNGEIVVIVPLIGLLVLDELIYTEVVEEIRCANPGIEDHTVDEVWNGILENLFHNPMESTKQKKRKEADQQRLQNVSRPLFELNVWRLRLGHRIQRTHRKHGRNKVSRRVKVAASTNDVSYHHPCNFAFIFSNDGYYARVVPDHVAAVPSSSQARNKSYPRRVPRSVYRKRC